MEIKSPIISTMLYFTFVFVSCISPVNSPPPDKTAPTVKVIAPAANDTVSAGSTEVIYEAYDDRGIESVELYLNDKFYSRTYPQTDESKPTVYLDVESSYINTRVTYYLIVYDLSANSATSEKITNIFVQPDMAPPIAPSELQLAKLSDTSINLRWQDNSDDELGFEVWRKDSSADYANIQTLPPNSISTNDTGLVFDIIYYYKVRAINQYNYSESNEVSTQSMVTVIEAPTDARAISFGTNWIRLSWQDNSDNELVFIIERKISSSLEFAQLATLSPNTTQYDDHKNLFASTIYTYRIAALSQVGQSDWSNEVTVTTLSIDLIPPSNLSASYDSTNNRVRLTWNDNSIYEVETRIERKTGVGGVFAEIGKVGINVTIFVDSALHTNGMYYYRVRGFVQEGLFSDYSNEAFVETTP